MKHYSKILLSLFVMASAFAASSPAQDKQLLKRTTYKTETIEFSPGGTVTLVGAPLGSVKIEGWSKNELEISAEIVVQAENEADLALLAAINSYVIDDTTGHVRILSMGTHDKDYLKRVAKKFPKRLLGLPFSINYTIKAPTFCDLEINTGAGDLDLKNIEGTIQIKAVQSNATLNLDGGTVNAVVGAGNLNVKLNSRSWRGRQASFQLASGILNVQFAQNLNAQIDASILREGKIENSLTALSPRDKTKFTDKLMLAKAGSGGALLSFTVGDGTLKMSNW